MDLFRFCSRLLKRLFYNVLGVRGFWAKLFFIMNKIEYTHIGFIFFVFLCFLGGIENKIKWPKQATWAISFVFFGGGIYFFVFGSRKKCGFPLKKPFSLFIFVFFFSVFVLLLK